MPTVKVPNEYRQHDLVFSEEAAKCFPPSQPEDHAIRLKPGAPAEINCKIYPLTKAELEAMHKFLDDKLALGFIEECDKGGSPWLTPWFFTGKKDGGLRPLQDYRVVNSWTIHDVYPIPQIEQILEELEGKVLFMALDIWWGYHNIWICEEDQWKAVLQFSPHVVPQCLCLSLRCVTCYLFKVPASVTCDHEYRLHKMDCLFCCSGSLYPT